MPDDCWFGWTHIFIIYIHVYIIDVDVDETDSDSSAMILGMESNTFYVGCVCFGGGIFITILCFVFIKICKINKERQLKLGKNQISLNKIEINKKATLTDKRMELNSKSPTMHMITQASIDIDSTPITPRTARTPNDSGEEGDNVDNVGNVNNAIIENTTKNTTNINTQTGERDSMLSTSVVRYVHVINGNDSRQTGEQGGGGEEIVSDIVDIDDDADSEELYIDHDQDNKTAGVKKNTRTKENQIDSNIL